MTLSPGRVLLVIPEARLMELKYGVTV